MSPGPRPAGDHPDRSDRPDRRDRPDRPDRPRPDHPDRRPDPRPDPRPERRDIAVAVLSFAVELGLNTDLGAAPGDGAAGVAVLVAYVGACSAPLAWRGRQPDVVFAVVVALALVGGATPLRAANTPFVPPVVALYTVAALRPLRRSLVALAAMALPTTQLVAERLRVRPDWTVTELVGLVTLAGAIYAAAWYAGRRRQAHRRQVSDLERRREEALADERLRLSRELHDTVSHAVSVTLLQASGAKQVLDRQPERAREALDHIEASSREAMGELRRLLTILRRQGELAEEGAELHRLAEVDELLRGFRDTGLDVGRHDRGRPRHLDPSVEHSAYRVVQESLTNVVRHAGVAGVAVTVSLSWDEELAVEVTNTAGPDGADAGAGGGGRHDHRGRRDGGGFGLLGLHERVRMVGGRLEAGQPSEGGFRVRAVLPTGPGADPGPGPGSDPASASRSGPEVGDA